VRTQDVFKQRASQGSMENVGLENAGTDRAKTRQDILSTLFAPSFPGLHFRSPRLWRQPNA